MAAFQDRLMVCGIAEAAHYEKSDIVGGIITASAPDITREAGYCGALEAGQELLNVISKRNIPHHQSHVFYPSHRKSYDFEAALDPVSPQHVLHEILLTLRFVGERLALMEKDQKLLIHCIRGKDRSATLALILLHEELRSVPDSLATLYKLRPSALLEGTEKFINVYFNQAAREEIDLYRYVNYKRIEEIRTAQAQGYLSVQDLFAAEAARLDPEESANRAKWLGNAQRYGMDLAL